MKREDLRAIEGLTEEQINQIMRLHGQDETAHQATVQGLQAQLTTAQQGLAAFDGVDVNDLRNQITNLTNQLTTAQQGLAAFDSVDVNDLRNQITNLTNQLTTQAAEYTFSGVLRTAAREAGALDEEDVIALLPNRATLRDSKNQSEDVKAAFADLKARKPYLFQQENPAGQDGDNHEQDQDQPGTPPIIIPKPRAQGGNAQPNLNEFLAMTGAERMALRTRNPALFQQLSAQIRAARH
jgi:hypothetical protein